ncbi:hypothetical protein BX265_6936 [Streptomyces sp. TLI_235]|nr:hypothetical protein [Streptomyces sp. TLI_235]PBC69604.1 hypothetical protein BX265_6936 [Streptomyces sp. TLI_235]
MLTVLVAVVAECCSAIWPTGGLRRIGEADLAHLWLLGAAGAVNTLNGWMPAARDWALAQGIPLLVVSYEVIAVWAVRNIGAGPRRARVPLALGAAGPRATPP